jgi:hypothetical protein
MYLRLLILPQGAFIPFSFKSKHSEIIFPILQLGMSLVLVLVMGYKWKYMCSLWEVSLKGAYFKFSTSLLGYMRVWG